MPAALSPCFLVAAPWLRCPYFRETVVLLLEHQEEGALGFVVNRPSSMTLDAVTRDLGMSPTCLTEGPVMVGGPVSPDSGWIVFEPRPSSPVAAGTFAITDRLRVSASRDVLESIAEGSGPQKHMLLLGYAGWGPDQLETEFRQGSWITVDLDESLIFDLPAERRWRAALDRVGIDPGRLTTGLVAEA